MTTRKPRKESMLKDTHPEAFAALGKWSEGVKRLRGRPPRGERPKVLKSVRFDADVLDKLQALGTDWQQQLNDKLREVLT
jgi:uncharacterized protein (DUF4415 family)